MKRIITAFMLITLNISGLATNVSVSGQTDQSIDKNSGWWPFLQIVIWPGVPSYSDKSVYGFRTGFPVSGGSGAVSGAELAPIISASDEIYGVQGAPLISYAKKAEGVRCSFMNISSKKTKGLQIGAMNLNLQNSSGLDIAVINVASGNMRGVQLGAGNYAGGERGVQFGIFNMSEWCGVQFGLINIIQNGWLPFCPIFNISF